MSDPGENAIAVAAETDDNGNCMNGDSLPKPGDTVTVTYIDEGYFIDSRTGEKSSENTPGEYIKYKVARSHDVRYTVCAVVSVPYSMSFRYSELSSIDAVINSERLRADSDAEIFPMFYMFDAPDRSAEDGDEAFLEELTSSPSSSLMYESKATVRAEFEGFRNMFTLLGGVLCVITGLVGILNFFNSIMTGMMSRRREFAVLQSIGMTGKTTAIDADIRGTAVRCRCDTAVHRAQHHHRTDSRQTAGKHVLVLQLPFHAEGDIYNGAGIPGGGRSASGAACTEGSPAGA